MRFFAVALIFSGVAASYAQTPVVPHKMRFADMTLTIRDDARREIQKDVDALTRSPKYFGIKVERARTYFPIIEKVFAEERLPDDFKFLVLQESALIADAVSVSDAVGFWQFKDFTAMEMGMRVDKVIDERMNIVSASRGAARYLKQSNFMFNNWLLALQAYQMGAGGVMRSVGSDLNGARHMDITSDTYWYVKKFLAHKVAFEEAVKGEPQVKMEVVELKEKKELKELVKELGVDEAELLVNNKWIKSGTIPGDRTYALVLPKGKFNGDFNTLAIPASAIAANTTNSMVTKPDENPVQKKINGIMTIQAKANDTHSSLASRAGIGLSELLKYNDITIADPIKAGTYYFTAKKKNKSKTLQHTVLEGEDVWLVSQRYGVSLKRILKLNRISKDEPLHAGDVVWLSSRKPLTPQPAVSEPASVVTPVVVAASGEQADFFDWEVTPAETDKKENNLIATNATKTTDMKVVSTPVEEEKPEDNKVLNSSGTHTVAAGETLYAISKRYNVGVTQLLEWNQLDITKGIKPGQQLSVTDPSGVISGTEAKDTSANDQWVTHEVKTSDTLYSVARQYNVTIKEIMDWNSKSDFNLAQGEKLKILPK